MTSSIYKEHQLIKLQINTQRTINYKYTAKNNSCLQTTNHRIYNFISGRNISKKIYNCLLSKISSPPVKSQQKWKTQLPQQNIDWSEVYSIPFRCTKDTKFRCFQYKLLHRILPTNKFLYQIRYIDYSTCSFCNSSTETINHLFFECPQICKLWQEFKKYVQTKTNLDFQITLTNILLGIFDKDLLQRASITYY